MKRHVIFLTLTLFFVIFLSGAVSAADPGNNSTNQIQTQSSNIILPPTQLLVRTVNNRTGTQYMGNDSINKAIQDTNTISGDTLLISNGTYDSVTLNKNLTLKWDGTGTGTVVSQLNITSGGSGSTINGLNITYSSTYDASGSYGINLNGVNNVTIENCTVNGFESGAGIWMVNSNNNTIIGTRLTDNKNGIELISSNGNNIGVSGSTLNSITGTGATSAPASYGIYICSSTNNEIYGSNIGTDAGSSQGFTYGIYFDHATGNNIIDSSNVWCNGAGIVLNWSNATITDDTEVAYNLNDGIGLYNSTAIINSYNYIDNNGGNGISVENSIVTINSRNNIYANSQDGINSLDSIIDVENNTIGGTSASDGNGYNGIYITYTDPSTSVNIIKNNKIQNNCQSGGHNIYMYNAVGNNLIQNNKVSDGYDGIYLASSNATIQNNTVNNNNEEGIFLGYSNATIQNNTVYSNGNGGIDLIRNSNAIIQNNTISNNNENWILNTGDGIYLANSNATIHDNFIYNNEAGIYLVNSNATIQDNSIYNNEAGIELDYSNAAIQNNIIRNNNGDGIFLSGSNATVNEGNNIYANGQNGINSQDSTVNIEDNTVGSDGASSNPTSGNGNDGILINYSTTSTNVNTIKGNKIRNNGQSGNYDGIYINNAIGNNLIQDNIISGNLYEGICLGNSNAIIQNNTLNNNSDAGIELDYSNATIQNNTIFSNVGDGIYLSNSKATINNGNNIYTNGKNGINSQDSAIDVENNTVGGDAASSNPTGGNKYGGILINYPTPSTDVNTINGNKIRKNSYNGISLTNAIGNNLIQNNIISENSGDGIDLTNSDAAIQNNTISSDDVGIYPENSNVTIQNNTINNNEEGGIFLENSTGIIQNNIINKNDYDGIGLENNSSATINNNTIGNNINYQIYFVNSTANIVSNNIYGDKGLFFDANNQLIQFNRIITTIEAIRNMGTGTVTATSNWFGSNSNPASKLFNNGSGVINCSSWLVLTLTANPTLIKSGGTSIITADLLHDSQGVCYDPNSGHVPDGISVDFETSLGTIDTQSAIVNGIAKSTLNGGSVNGGAAVSSIVDSQISQISVNVDTISPTAAVNIPGGLYNTNKTIILSINEPGTIYYTINGDIPTTTSRKYIEPISIMSTTILRFMAVDLAGNPSTVYSQTYTIDKIPPKVISTYPKRYATGVSRTRTIYLKFSEKIKKGSYWSKIMVKNKYGHAVSISKSISGNTIYIKTSKRGSYSYYTVYIPSAAVKDYAGNKLAKGYSFKFKTGR